MRVIGVIDLLGGRAVHAQGGCRLGYRPVQAVAGATVNGDAAQLARLYVARLRASELYVADLDAIAGGTEHDDIVRQIAACGVPLWLDAGIATVAQAQRARARGAAHVVVGLETLPALSILGEISAAIGRQHVAFSLDLRGGIAVSADEALRFEAPPTIASRAVAAGAASVIVLDLDRIGAARGLDVELLKTIREAIPGVPLLAGGGVRGVADLEALADAGCDGALVATALHAGSLRDARPDHHG